MEYAQKIQIAQELARSGQYEKAAAACEELIATEPRGHEALHLRGVLHNLGGRAAEALDCIQRAVAIEPDVAKYHLNLGNAYLSLNRLGEARVAYENALKLDGNYQDAHYNLGTLLLKQDDAKEAEFHFKRAVEGPVPMAGAWAQLANIQETENRLDEAMHSVECGLALADGNPFLRIVEARLLRRKKQPETALARLSDFSQVWLPTNLDIGFHYEMGMLNDQLGQPDEAFEHFSKSNQVQLDDPAVKFLKPENYLAAIERLGETSLGSA